MKKYISFFLIAMQPAWLFAESVDTLVAKQVATTFMNDLFEQSGAKSASAYNDYSCQKYGNIYVINNADGGWVLVSADDCVRPILAYSPDGEFSIENIAPAAKDLVLDYSEQITNAQNVGFHGSIDEEWKQLKNGKVRSRLAKNVEPLIKTKWDQSPGYNDFCPEIDGEKTVTGCVATAMAQVMNYWQWPKRGVGFHEYQSQNCGTVATVFGATDYEWNIMPEQLHEGSGWMASSSEDEIEAIANIMYDCGVSVDMNYGLESSGIRDPQKVKDALVKYFKYSPKMTLESKDKYSDDEWIDKLKKELNDSRPILYYGFGTNGGGHAFICDGYDANDYFHFNWGWSGYGDAYYYINGLAPTENGIGSNENGTYNDNQQAFFGVEPLYGVKEYDLRVYESSLTAYDTNGYELKTLWLGDDAYYYAKIANYGDTDFSGSFAVAVFDLDSRFVAISNVAHYYLQSNYCTSNYMEFKINGTFNYVTGKYYLARLMYKDEYTNDWTIVSDDSVMLSMTYFDVNYSAPISINSEISVFDNVKKEKVTTKEFIQGDEYTYTVGIKNTGTEDYVGEYVLSLINSKGEILQKIGTHEQKQPLKPNASIDIMFQGTMTAMPGTYLLNVSYMNGEGLSLAGAINCSNPEFYNVKIGGPDQYENNNTIFKAYMFPLEFDENDSAMVITFTNENNYIQLSNLHEFRDVDYYKFDLARGYNYEINATIINRNDDVDELIQTTADDVVVKYSYDGINWIEGHDYEYRCSKNIESDDRYDRLTVENGGKVYVAINHPWGMTGTYIFGADVIRTPIQNNNLTSIIDAQTEISVYPNPATDYLTISSSDCYTINNVVIYDCQGRKVMSSNNPQINVSGLNDGIYIVEIQTNRGVIKRKISKQ